MSKKSAVRITGPASSLPKGISPYIPTVAPPDGPVRPTMTPKSQQMKPTKRVRFTDEKASAVR